MLHFALQKASLKQALEESGNNCIELSPVQVSSASIYLPAEYELVGNKAIRVGKKRKSVHLLK